MASVTDMSNILEKMSLGYVCQRFIDENITPDIVCMLSLSELNRLGLRNHSEIMALRIECIKYSGGQPLKSQGLNAHVKYEIPREILEGFLISEIATMMSVSESTIYRRMRCYGLSKLTFSDVTEEQLDAHVAEIAKDFPFCGEKMFKQILEQKGIRVQRMRLRDSIHRVDAEGVENRRKRRLHRRVYNVKGPNHLWHVDTNHKLVRWNFIIVGGIDGFSRLPVMLVCTNNNKSETLLSCFLGAISEYGLPSRVRTDKGLENVLIADLMIEKRGSDRGSIITGPSTHNQRIERLWRDVFQGVLSYYYHLFYFLEDQLVLDPFDDKHIATLHYTYMDEINSKLRIWQKAWSNHRMRTTRSSPYRLWIAGQAQNPTGLDQSIADWQNFGVEGNVDLEDDLEEEGRPIFSPPVLELSENCRSELASIVSHENNYRVEHYMLALEIIQRNT